MLDCDFDKIGPIFRQAHEVELMTDYHNYLVTSLDLDKVSLEEFSHTVSLTIPPPLIASPPQNVNITGFRLVDPSSAQARRYLKKYPSRWSLRVPRVQPSTVSRAQGRAHPLFSTNALMYDAVQLLARALTDLDSLQVILLLLHSTMATMSTLLCRTSGWSPSAVSPRTCGTTGTCCWATSGSSPSPPQPSSPPPQGG